jgi:hypothetical protein
MSKAEAKDPTASITGLQPRYVRERQAAADMASAKLAADAANRPPSPDVNDLLHAMRPVDAATSDLRRRIVEAKPRRMSLGVTMPQFPSVSFMTGLLLDH